MKRKFNLGKNQVVLSVLVLMIAVAGYLNYIDSNNELNPIVLSDNGEVTSIVRDETTKFTELPTIGDNGIVEISTIGDTNITLEKLPLTDESTEIGEAILVNAQISRNYFTETKLNREQSRSMQRELLLELINNDKLSSAERAKFSDRMLEMQSKIEKETAAESIIKSKGFGEAYVRIDDTTVDVVVDKEKLTAQDIAQINDIVTRKTNLPVTAVKISPYTNSK